MKKLIASVFIVSLSFSFPVNSEDLFDEFDAEMNEFEAPDNEKLIQEYLSFVSEYLTEYDEWRKEYLHGFDNKQAKIINRWGNTTNPSIKNVEYSENLNAREMIDYENNEVIIEILVPVETTEAESEAILKSYIADSQQKSVVPEIKETVVIDAKNEGTEEIVVLNAQDSPVIETVGAKETPENQASAMIPLQEVKSKNISLNPVYFDEKQESAAKAAIKAQTVAYQKEAEVKGDRLQESQESIPQEVIEQSVQKQKVLLIKEEMQRIAKVEAQYAALRKESEKAVPEYKVLKYSAKLPRNSLSKRAQKYKAFAEKESQRFDIPVALVMAIMHSESAFEPRAKSAVPAYGLMQIVPRTAGHDVNKMVRKIDKPMKVADLYQPKINVETGSAYLNILDKRYLRSIKDPESRLYCTIAAYNTGAGNVAKVFNKTGNRRNIHKAAKVINTLSPEQVYSALINHLPYDETKHYLKKVSKRISLYEIKTEI